MQVVPHVLFLRIMVYLFVRHFTLAYHPISRSSFAVYHALTELQITNLLSHEISVPVTLPTTRYRSYYSSSSSTTDTNTVVICRMAYVERISRVICSLCRGSRDHIQSHVAQTSTMVFPNYGIQWLQWTSSFPREHSECLGEIKKEITFDLRS